MEGRKGIRKKTRSGDDDNNDEKACKGMNGWTGIELQVVRWVFVFVFVLVLVYVSCKGEVTKNVV